MVAWELFTSPVVLFLFALVTVYLVYAWSSTIAPAFIRSANKAMPYVGGEAMEARTFLPGYQFFYVALFFTVVHVAALFIAIAPPGAPLWATLGYLGIMAVAITALRWEQ